MSGELERAEALAKECMRGTRDGSEQRPAWEHPADVVKLLRTLPGWDQFRHRDFVEAVAWTHDVLEDGTMPDGTPAGTKAFNRACLGSVLVEVRALTMQVGDNKAEYLAKLCHGATALQATVKVADRICNLREGAATFGDRRWTRYVDQTLQYFPVLLRRVWPEFHRTLRANLLSALAVRP